MNRIFECQVPRFLLEDHLPPGSQFNWTGHAQVPAEGHRPRHLLRRGPPVANQPQEGQRWVEAEIKAQRGKINSFVDSFLRE